MLVIYKKYPIYIKNIKISDVFNIFKNIAVFSNPADG